jgi:hypothetical protein
MKTAFFISRLIMAVLIAALTIGCDVVGTVIDLSNTQTDVTSMHVSGKGTLTVITGGAIHKLPLDALESVVLFPGETRVINGELCFAAEVFLKDGAHMQAHDKMHDNNPLTFISSNATILGKSNRGDFKVEMTNVLKITFRQP